MNNVKVLVSFQYYGTAPEGERAPLITLMSGNQAEVPVERLDEFVAKGLVEEL